MFKKVVTYLAKAVRSNTGVSSLSLIAVIVSMMAVVTLTVICISMMIEVIANHTIASSLEGYASIITAIAGLVAAVGIPKALNNYGENKFNDNFHTLKADDTEVS